MRKGGFRLALLCVALLGAMVAKNLLEQPPALRLQSISGQFDAVRAKARLTVILGDQQPHPADSAADQQIRARLVTALIKLGLKPVVRDQFVCNALFKQRGVACGRVRNVIARLGPEGGKALLLNAHYDSVPVGPGASDDGIGVATLLEVGGILKDRPLRRPVILLFNEGEELGLLGARAFLADPLSLNVDSLINLEARGVSGPANMFETSRPNGPPIALFAASAKNPVANSLSTDVYRLLPNYSDVNSFSERGWLTLNLAPIGNETLYHSGGDDLAALDPATLQHMGDQTLALTEKLGDGTPLAKDGNRIFMDLAGSTLVSLPLIAGAILDLVLVAVFMFLAVRGGELPRGIIAVAGTIVGSALLAWGAVNLIGTLRGGMFWRAHPNLSDLAAYASSLFVGTTLFASVTRNLDRRQLQTAFWLLFLILGCGVGMIAPGGIIFFIFPPLLASIGIILAPWWRPAESVGSAAAILFLYVTLGGLLGLLEKLLDSGPIWIFAPLGSLLILPVLIEAKPLIVRAGTNSAAAISGALTLAAWAAAGAAPAYSAEREQRFVIEHVTDSDHRSSWWSVLNDGAPLPGTFPESWKRGKLPLSDRTRWLAPAPADPSVRPPDVQILSQVENGNERTLQLRFAANGNESVVLIAPGDAKIKSAGNVGFARPIEQIGAGKYSVSCFGRSCDGAIIELSIGQRKPEEFTIAGSRAPLPPSAAPLLAKRPKFARAQYNRDEEIAFTTRRI